MADDTALLEKLILDSQVPKDPLRCPECKSAKVAITGTFQRGFRQMLNDGNVTGQILDPDVRQHVDSLYCAACDIEFRIEDAKVVELSREVLELRTSHAALTGKLNPGSSLPC